MSGGRTLPPVTVSMRAATRIDGPRSRNRSLRTPNSEMPPIRSAMSESERPSDRIHAFKVMAGLLPTAAVTPTELAPGRLAEALAVLMVDIVEVLAVSDRRAARERLANILFEQGLVPGGNEAAVLLGAVGGALMRLET